MAALLITLSVMAVMMTMAMPVWKQSAQREKEAELVFRGQQYARAVGLFQRRHGPGTLPPTLDVLLTEHDLRKKYKDPITNDDFDVVKQGQAGTVATASRPGETATTTTQTPSTARSSSPSAFPIAPSGPTGGIMGVASKSKAPSIRIFNGRTHYNEWVFLYQPPVQAPGAGTPGVPGTGGRGGVPGTGGPGGPVGTGGRGDGGQGGRGGPIGFPPSGPTVPAPTPRRPGG